ncbi:5'/3'-nucleotidase SurE [Sulfidibacter corallicola]|uniref:5'-nucleotidase SurE n=1 Tax=Sulfidibacter corallicola TaxID=2818388 RepID=A0A8A4TYL7_SULCO|nr:5'/3'-nucleotidase SurE [Sulfidibacter corallicola]QTD54351.1 5'/3'-nucleotidase SurE [Sulfidibacter corallicola]
MQMNQAETHSVPTILVCNDDGYFSAGIKALCTELAELGRVIVVAPEQDNSGVSRKVSLDTPLRLRPLGEATYAVNGTPVDCVHLGIRVVLEGVVPDLIVSGINHGPNLGLDTAYSGTVAAAWEGFHYGAPALAVSVGRDEQRAFAVAPAARVARGFAAWMLERPQASRHAIWNLNVPGKPLRGLRFVPLDERCFQTRLVTRTDPRGKDYYWLGPYHPDCGPETGTDLGAFYANYITATPLQMEMTDTDLLKRHEGEFQDDLQTLVEVAQGDWSCP